MEILEYFLLELASRSLNFICNYYRTVETMSAFHVKNTQKSKKWVAVLGNDRRWSGWTLFFSKYLDGLNHLPNK